MASSCRCNVNFARKCSLTHLQGVECECVRENVYCVPDPHTCVILTGLLRLLLRLLHGRLRGRVLSCRTLIAFSNFSTETPVGTHGRIRRYVATLAKNAAPQNCTSHTRIPSTRALFEHHSRQAAPSAQRGSAPAPRGRMDRAREAHRGEMSPAPGSFDTQLVKK